LRRNAWYSRNAVLVVIPGTVCRAAFANAAESCGSNCSKTDSMLIRTVVYLDVRISQAHLELIIALSYALRVTE
jgi:hypothetical protein